MTDNFTPFIDFTLRRVHFAPDEYDQLTGHEWTVLNELVRAAGRPVSVDRLIFAMYGGAREPDNARRVLYVIIQRLRRILPWPIRNLIFTGYWLEGYGAS